MTTDPTIPGLEPPKPTDGPMAKAAAVTLAALRDAGELEPRHSVLVQLVQSLSAAIDRGVVAGRASAVAMAAAQLRETMLVLDPPPEDGDADVAARKALAEFLAHIEDVANLDEVPQ